MTSKQISTTTTNKINNTNNDEETTTQINESNIMSSESNNINEDDDNNDTITIYRKKRKRPFSVMTNEDLKTDNEIIILDIKNIELTYVNEKGVFVGDLRTHIYGSIKTAIFYCKDGKELLNMRIKTNDYKIKNNIYHIKSYTIIGPIPKHKRRNIQRRKYINNKKIKMELFAAYNIGCGPRYRPKDSLTFNKDFFFIDKTGNRSSFRAFRQNIDRMSNIIQPNKLYIINNFDKWRDGKYTITNRTKMSKVSNKQLTKKELFNFIDLDNIKDLLDRNIQKQKFDVIGKIVSINLVEQIGKQEITLTDGTNEIGLVIWKANIDFYKSIIKQDNNIIVLSGEIDNERRENIISNFLTILDANKFNNINNKKIENVQTLDIKPIRTKVTNKRRNLVTINGDYDMFRRVTIQQINNIHWKTIRVKKLNNNLKIFNKHGKEDKSIQCIVVGSITSIPNAGNINMIYPVKQDLNQLGRKKVYYDADIGWYEYNIYGNIVKVNDIGFRYHTKITISDFTGQLDITCFDESINSLLQINNKKLNALTYYESMCKDTIFEDQPYVEFQSHDPVFENHNVESLRNQILSIKENRYIFGLKLEENPNENYEPNYTLQSVSKIKYNNDVKYMKKLIKKFNEKLKVKQ